MKFELFVALRNLRAKRKMAVFSVITAISVLGIAAGVLSVVVALAVNNGFRQDLQGRLLGATAHVQVQRRDGSGIENWREMLHRLSTAPGILASAPALYGTVLASHAGRATSQMILKGVDPQAEAKVGNILDSVREGSKEALSAAESSDTMPPVLIGKVMANTLGVVPGDVLLLMSPQGPLTPFGMVPRYRKFRVAGVFDSGFYDFDANWAFTSLAAAQQLLDLDDVVSVLEFKIGDIYQAPGIAQELEQMAGPAYAGSNWMEQNHALFSALKMEKTITTFTIGLIVLVAALNILISLVMTVMEKYRDIAILISMGARRKQSNT